MAFIVPKHGDLVIPGQKKGCHREPSSPSEKGFPNGFCCLAGYMTKPNLEMDAKFRQPAKVLLAIPFELIQRAQDIRSNQIAGHVGFDGFVDNKPVRL